MALLEVSRGSTRFSIDLENHNHVRKTELPIEKLGAIFIESSGQHSLDPNILSYTLTHIDRHLPQKGEVHSEGTVDRVKDILSRARESGTEIWLGDISPTKRELLTSVGLNLTINLPWRIPGQLLSKPGLATKRPISKAITKAVHRFDPNIHFRNLVMGAKILKLADISGHKEIGIAIGAGHVGMEDVLSGKVKLEQKHMDKLAKRGEGSLLIFRCKYNPTFKRWFVEKHSL